MATNPRTSPIIERILERADWRALLERDYAATAARLQAAYARLLPDLQDRFDLLAARMGQGDPLTGEDVRGLREFRDLLRRIEGDLAGFGRLALDEAGWLGERGIERGTALARGMAAAQMVNPRLLAGAWLTPDPAALAQLANYADGSAMRTRLLRFGPDAAQHFSDTLLALTAQGKDSRAIARAMSQWWNVPYHWAENSTRTAQQWSYRASSHASYRANPRVVTGWVWWAALDDRTCLSCVGQHGGQHETHETLADHHRGRCTPLPIVTGTTWAEGLERGEDWFARQSPARQRDMMGPSLFEAWRRGQVRFSELSRPYSDSVYGTMLRQATNAELGVARLGRRIRQTPQSPAPPPGNVPPAAPVETLETVEARIRGLGAEQAFAFDASGGLLFSQQGRASSVDFTAEQIAQLRQAGDAILTHNHPGGLPFSAEDYLFAAHSNLAQMRAVGRRGETGYTYILERGAAGWMNTPVTRMRLEGFVRRRAEIIADLADAYRPRVRRGEIPEPEAELAIYHEAWERLALHYGFTYRREVTDET